MDSSRAFGLNGGGTSLQWELLKRSDDVGNLELIFAVEATDAIPSSCAESFDDYPALVDKFGQLVFEFQLVLCDQWNVDLLAPFVFTASIFIERLQELNRVLSQGSANATDRAQKLTT